jgi:hypothetical protein
MFSADVWLTELQQQQQQQFCSQSLMVMTSLSQWTTNEDNMSCKFAEGNRNLDTHLE